MGHVFLEKYGKLDIALSLLDKAIKIYQEGDHYFAALHLAGAAEEVLGKFLKKKGIDTSLESEKEAFVLVNRELLKRTISEKYAADFLNKAKNSIKHMDEKNADDEYVVMDPKEDANNMIQRALTNCWRLELELTPLMQEFWK